MTFRITREHHIHFLSRPLYDARNYRVCSGSRFIYRRLFDDWVSTISDSDESMAHPFYYIDFGDIQDMDFLEAVCKEVAPAGPQVNRMVASNDEDLLHNVRTSLPYYAVETRRETFNWSTVLIDGNRIICSRPVEVRHSPPSSTARIFVDFGNREKAGRQNMGEGV